MADQPKPTQPHKNPPKNPAKYRGVDPGVLVKSSEVQSLPRLPAIGIACCLCCCMGQPRQSSREVRRVDPELQPIGWAMEEEMEDPGEEVPSCSWGGGVDSF